METIQNIAAAASKVIYGEQTTTNNETGGEEPISGESGQGTVDSPFDQGNATSHISTSTHPASNTVIKAQDTTTPEAEATLPDRTAIDSDNMSSSSPSSGPFSNNPVGSATDGPSDPNSIPTNPHNAAEGGAPETHRDTEKTGVVGGHGDPFATNDKSTERSANPGPVSSEPNTKQQGAANPNDEPKGEQKDAVKDTKDDAEDFLKTKDPNDHSGEPMHMHTGGPDGDKEAPRTQEERRDSKLGQPGGQEHGKEEEGTGEQWVKTTGIAADGGNFDATKPGAGREANRLMEEKGIHKSEPGKPAPPPDASNESKGKVPLGQKIKDKLHIGSHKN